MLKFIPANNLKKDFNVFGHFYTLNLESGETIDCRSVLEIIEKKSTPSSINSLSIREPNAIFIMMNPGSSVPLQSVDNAVASNDIDKLKISLVLAKPDVTQYQVMRIMHYCGWSHVRVLNISDLRDPSSGKFAERFINLEKRTGLIDHSLFSGKRNSELKTKIQTHSYTPIICAWGVSKDLNPLIDRCLTQIGTMPNIKGLLKPNTEDKYFHPLPTLQKDKELWVNNMVKMILT